MEKRRVIAFIIIVLALIIGIIFSIVYYDNKYIVSFETGNEEIILSQFVKKGNKVVKPKDPFRENYIFLGWENKGELYDFNNPVTSNLELSAKWAKEEYINVKYVIKDETYENKIIKGSSIEDLQAIDDISFIGWFIDGEVYDGHEIYSDVTIEARFKDSFKIGDKVCILDKYSSSSDGEEATYYKGIGWNRYILNILDGENFPYVVGNDEGVTGYFKQDSIKIVE